MSVSLLIFTCSPFGSTLHSASNTQTACVTQPNAPKGGRKDQMYVTHPSGNRWTPDHIQHCGNGLSSEATRSVGPCCLWSLSTPCVSIHYGSAYVPAFAWNLSCNDMDELCGFHSSSKQSVLTVKTRGWPEQLLLLSQSDSEVNNWPLARRSQAECLIPWYFVTKCFSGPI